MKTSINFKQAKCDSEAHNFRKKYFDYVQKDLSSTNEYWVDDSIVDRLAKIEKYCKVKSGRKLQKNAFPIREAVVVTKKDTTMVQLHELSGRLEQELGIKVFQIAIHRDEGHRDPETKEWKTNHHAHLVADWQDLETGKMLRHKGWQYSRMQDIAAECLDMERGVAGAASRLEAIQYKIAEKEKEYLNLVEKTKRLNEHVSTRVADSLIVEYFDFLGFKSVNLEKTISKFTDEFRRLSIENAKLKSDLAIKNRQLSEKENRLEDLQKANEKLKSNLASIYLDPQLYKEQGRKYLTSVKNVILSTTLSELTYSGMESYTDVHVNNIIYKTLNLNGIPHTAISRLSEDKEFINKFWNEIDTRTQEIKKKNMDLKNKNSIKYRGRKGLF